MNTKPIAATLLTAIFLVSALAAIPASASPEIEPELSTWNEATAQWSTAEAYTGRYSVFQCVDFDGTRDASLYQGDKYGEEGSVISLPAPTTTLTDFTEFKFQFLMMAGIESPRTAMLLDTDDDGLGDVWLVSNSYDYNTAPYWNDVERTYKAPDTWQLHDETYFMVWTQNATLIGNLRETAKEETGGWYRPESGMLTLSQLLSKGLTGDIVRYEVRLDGVDKDPLTGSYHAGVPVTCGAYIDDATINGVTYHLETLLGLLGVPSVIVHPTLTNDATAASTIGWSTEQAHSGSYSVKMTLEQNPSYPNGINIRDIIPWNQPVSTISSVYFWLYPTYSSTCYPTDEQAPFLMLYIDRDGDGTVDVYLIASDTNIEPDSLPNSIIQNQWNMVTWYQGWHSWVVPDNPPLDGTPPPQRTGSYAEWQAYYTGTYPDHVVTTFRVGWGYEDSTAEVRTAYLDDLVINGVIYNLEPPPPPPPKPIPAPYSEAQVQSVETVGNLMSTLGGAVVAGEGAGVAGEQYDYNGDGVVNVDDAFNILCDAGVLHQPSFSFEPQMASASLGLLQGIYGENLERYPSVEGRVWLLYMLT